MERWPKDVLITTLITLTLLGVSYMAQNVDLNLKTSVGVTMALIAIVFIQIGMMPFVKLKWKVYPFYISLIYISVFLGTELNFDPNYMFMAWAIPLSAFALYGYNLRTDMVWEKKYTIGVIAFLFVGFAYANAF